MRHDHQAEGLPLFTGKWYPIESQNSQWIRLRLRPVLRQSSMLAAPGSAGFVEFVKVERLRRKFINFERNSRAFRNCWRTSETSVSKGRPISSAFFLMSLSNALRNRSTVSTTYSTQRHLAYQCSIRLRKHESPGFGTGIGYQLCSRISEMLRWILDSI